MRILKTFLAFVLTMCLIVSTVVYADEIYAAQNDAGSYFIGNDNYIFTGAHEELVLAQAVSGLIGLQATELFFVTEDSDDPEQHTHILWSTDVESADDPQEIAHVAGLPVWYETNRAVYYVPEEAPSELWAYNTTLLESGKVCDADGAISRLRLSSDGLLVTTPSGEKLYVPALHGLFAPNKDLSGCEIELFGENMVILDAQGSLFVRVSGLTEDIPVDDAVLCKRAGIDGITYFKSVDGGVALMRYQGTAGQSETLYTLADHPFNELAVYNGRAYWIAENGDILSFAKGDSAPVKLGAVDTNQVHYPRLLTFADQLLVYDIAGNDAETYVLSISIESPDAPVVEPADPETETEVETEAEAQPEEDDEEADDAPAEESQPAPKVVPTPVPFDEETTQDFSLLSKGSRGDAVARLQKRLIELDYLSGGADGVYGEATKEAIVLLQSDLGLTQNGSASASLQYKLYHKHVKPYSRYVDLSKGDEGVRVQELQTRLRDLYYMKVNAGGHYKTATVAAVKLFQKQAGYKATGNITAKQLKVLLSKKAKQYNGYLDLEKGDKAPAVKRLVSRLKKLGYYTGKVTSTYNSKVVKAVELFTSYNGLLSTGKASKELQENMIFASGAKHYESSDPDPDPKPSQAITNKQLKAMRVWMNKHLKKSFDNPRSVKFLQTKLRKLGYNGVEITKVYDRTTKLAVEDYQGSNGLDPTGVPNGETLKLMFNK